MPAFSELTHKQWIIASFAGWICGAVLVIFTSGAFDSVGLEGFQFYLGLSIGGGVGLFQWLKFFRHTTVGLNWIWSSLLGMGFPFFVFDLMRIYGGYSFGPLYLPFSVVSGGCITAVLQMFLLRNISGKSFSWIWICWGGWIAASMTVFAVDYIKLFIHHNLTLFVINLTLILSGGAVLGAVTGTLLMKILNDPENGRREVRAGDNVDQGKN